VPHVASSTQAHAAHARAHGGPRHAKPQRGSDFAAMLDEMASAKADAGAEAVPAQISPAQGSPDQTAEVPVVPVKAGDATVLPQITPPPATPQADARPQADATPQAIDVTALPVVSPAPVPQDPKLAATPATPVPVEPPAGKQLEDDKTPDTTDLPVQTAAVVPGTLPVPVALPPPALASVPVPAQASPAPAQQAQPVESVTQAPGLALVAPLARQTSQQVKAAKAERPEAAATPDDQPQAPAGTAEETPALVTAAKDASPTPTPQSHLTEAAPHRDAPDLASDKQAAPQSFDDLIAPGNAQPGASPAGNAGASGQTQSASPASAASAAAPAPQGQLAPVPLSGVPVLIAGRALAGSNHFDIRLDPPELGRIEVRLKVGRDGQVSSHLIADRADTLALLRRDQTGLERALQDAGLKTGGDGLQFSLRDHGGHAQSDGRSGGSTLLVQDNANPTSDLPRGYTSYVGRAGGIDIHV